MTTPQIVHDVAIGLAAAAIGVAGAVAVSVLPI